MPDGTSKAKPLYEIFFWLFEGLGIPIELLKKTPRMNYNY